MFNEAQFLKIKETDEASKDLLNQDFVGVALPVW